MYSVVLHPCHKLDYFKKAGWEDAWIDSAQQIVRDEFDRSYVDNDMDDDSNDSGPMVSLLFCP